MVDRLFADVELAALYDSFCPREQRGDFRFYLPLVMSAQAVLDVGCGTGSLLHWARESGHTGRLCGLDPAAGMLERARSRSDIEWVRGDLGAVDWRREFDLVVMTGHAFQVLLVDDELRTALEAVRDALTEDGRFAFETRNPLAREWEQWTAENAEEAIDASSGAIVRMEREVAGVEGELVHFSHTFTSTSWDRKRVSRSTLRSLDAASVSSFLSGAGMLIDRQLGDWNGGPLTDRSPEIVTIARRAS